MSKFDFLVGSGSSGTHGSYEFEHDTSEEGEEVTGQNHATAYLYDLETQAIQELLERGSSVETLLRLMGA